MEFKSPNTTKFMTVSACVLVSVGAVVLHLQQYDSPVTMVRSERSAPRRLLSEQVAKSQSLQVQRSQGSKLRQVQHVEPIRGGLGGVVFDQPSASQNSASVAVAFEPPFAVPPVTLASKLGDESENDRGFLDVEINFSPDNGPYVLDVRQDLSEIRHGEMIDFSADAQPWDIPQDIFIVEQTPARKPEYIATETKQLQDTGDDIEKKHNLGITQPGIDPWHMPLADATAQQLARGVRIRKCLDFYYSRLLNTNNDSPWSIMHHMIAWGSDAQIWVGGFKGKQVSAIGWLCGNGICENERLLTLNDGSISPRIGPGLQGHEGQFLAMLAQARVQKAQPIRIDGYEFTVQDLIDQEKRTCVANTELTFKLIGLVHYLGTEAEWESEDGQRWNIERLIQEEIRQPINGVTCGGTHRLMSLSYAVRRRMQDGLPIDGEFARAEKYTADYRNFAYQLRTPEGSFSTDFFRSARYEGDMNRKLKTTGHVLEWMIFSSSHDELADPRLTRVLDLQLKWMVDNRYFDWDTGPLGHAVRALALYDERVYGGLPGHRGFEVVENPPWISPNPNKPKNRAKAAMLRQATSTNVSPHVEPVRQAPGPARRGMNFLRRSVR